MIDQDTWLRKHHELWQKLEVNTKSSFCTALWKWLVPTQGYATCDMLSNQINWMHAYRLGVTAKVLTLSYIQYPNV